jgi:indole-3-glycerol phosphate synthase
MNTLQHRASPAFAVTSAGLVGARPARKAHRHCVTLCPTDPKGVGACFRIRFHWRTCSLRAGQERGSLMMTEPLAAQQEELVDWLPAGALEKDVMRKFEYVRDELSNREPLSFRLSYMSEAPSRDIRAKLRRRRGRLSVVVDLKRRSATSEPAREFHALNMYAAAEILSDLRAEIPLGSKFGLDGIMVSVDSELYDQDCASLSDFARHWRYFHREDPSTAPPIIYKDIIVHELQLAEAAEAGAKAACLVAGACLPDLEKLLNAAYILGMEVLVEVHTEEELQYAFEAGAGIYVFTDVDRARRRVVKGRAVDLMDKYRVDLRNAGAVCLGSGRIETLEQVEQLRDVGADGIVIGGKLMASIARGDVEALASVLHSLLVADL